ncbi:MAG: threonylcarbamoyl-AMP synthase [bacterium]|nr:threonylcarbamoyl-AMP synthase [bacterium]
MIVPSTVRASEVSGREIASWLAAGAVVVLPTETVYGLAVQPGMPSGLQRVFELKGRPKELNLPVMIGATHQLNRLGVDYSQTARRLAGKFWPGPLTIVMGFAPDSSRPAWLAGRVEVAIRLPGLKLLREVAETAGAILVTSANGHGAGPKRVASEAVDSLHGAVDVIVDGGTLSPLPSTIINTRVSPPRIERLGVIAAAEIAELIGETSLAVK